MTRSVR